MKRIMILILFLFILSCSQVIKEDSFCKHPYIEWRVGECCLDENNNFICDVDEKKIVEKIKEEQKPVKKVNILQDLLAQAPEKYWFQSYDAGKVIVIDDKRRSYVNVDKGITDIYWNTKNKEAVELCNIKEEIMQEGTNFQPDRPICNPDFLNIRRLTKTEYEERFPMGPVDWMIKFKDKKPFLVETFIQTLGVKSISPIIHFLEADGSIIVLKFDYYKKIPIVVDTIKNKVRINSLKYLFSTDFKLIGINKDVEKTMIIPKDKPIIEDPIIITVKETEFLLNNKVFVKGKVTNQGYDYLEPVNLMVECFNKENEIIGHIRTRTFEGITKYKDTDFKAYVSIKTKNFAYCTARLN